MSKFGILSDVVAVKDGTPHIKLSSIYMVPTSRWVYYHHNAIHRMPGRVESLTVTPDGFPILRYQYHAAVDGTYYVFAFTKAHAYKWNGTTAWVLMFTCSSDCDAWSTVSFNNKIIATNWVDKVQIWLDSTPGTAFANMGSASGIDIGSGDYLTKAKIAYVYQNFLHFFYTQEGGTTYPGRHRWSSSGNEADFDETGSGNAGHRDYSAGAWVVGVGSYTAGGNDLLVAMTDHTIETEWLVTDDMVFDWKTVLRDLGCVAADSIVNDLTGNLFWLGTDSCVHRFLDDTRISQDIDNTVSDMHPTLKANVRAKYIGKYNRLWWAFPQNGASTANDTVMSLHLDTMSWDPFYPMAISAFGQYKAGTTYTIDTIPFATIDGIAWETIDSYENVAGWPFDICGDYAGLSYQVAADYVYDAGAAFESLIHMGTDFTMDQALADYKRMHGFWVWFKRHPLTDYEAMISIQTENDDTPQLAATIDLATGTGHGNILRQWCPYDCRSRDFIIEVSANQDFSWYGILFDFDLDGDR